MATKFPFVLTESQYRYGTDVNVPSDFDEQDCDYDCVHLLNMYSSHYLTRHIPQNHAARSRTNSELSFVARREANYIRSKAYGKMLVFEIIASPMKLNANWILKGMI